MRHANVGQQVLNRRDLFLAHLDMAQNEGGCDLEGADQVNRGTVGEVIEAAAQGLAIASTATTRPPAHPIWSARTAEWMRKTHSSSALSSCWRTSRRDV
jgi:hypothetical protein